MKYRYLIIEGHNAAGELRPDGAAAPFALFDIDRQVSLRPFYLTRDQAEMARRRFLEADRVLDAASWRRETGLTRLRMPHDFARYYASRFNRNNHPDAARLAMFYQLVALRDEDI